jgi:UDP-N-acetylmuramoyl-tripeptide--D-alanyl-D-alanine ligase
MKLSYDFLIKALPEAHYYWGATALSLSKAIEWQALENKGEVLVSIDSRSLQANDFFIPLKGENFDGHNFIADALKKGACGCLIATDRRDYLDKIPATLKAEKLFIIVPDTLDAFIALAKSWRQQLSCPVVAITGSVGKTSTKEMLKTIMHAAGLQAFVSFKNYNNVFGLCYNILRIPASVQAAVLELGINDVGEMRQLADILRPTIGVITCIAHAHLEGLSNVQTVSQEKRQLFAFFTPQDVGIIWGDQPLLTNVHYAHPIARFGLKTKNQVQARRVRIDYDDQYGFTTHFNLKWYGQKAEVQLKGNHPGFITNALAASTVAYFLKISFQHVVEGLLGYQGLESRFEIRTLKGNKGIVLNDCYNANPESMKAALLAFAQFKAEGPKIAVLGDMLELGQKEGYWHRQIGRVINKSSLNLQSLVLVGERARMIGKTAPLHMPLEYAQDWKEAQQKLEQILKQSKSAVLVKASHGVHLDELVKAISE